MLPIKTEYFRGKKVDTQVHIVQQVVDGPSNLLHRKITLVFRTPKEATEFAIGILMNLVPAEILPDYSKEFQLLAKASISGNFINDQEEQTNQDGQREIIR